MLECLTIDNIALIEHSEIDFSDGFCVLTGETGAGKSILIGSINMMLGERVSKDLIRHGAKKARVQGVFHVSNPEAISYLEENGFETEDGSLILSRELSEDGKNTCRVGGTLVPVSKLRELGRYLMNVHGQHDNQALLDTTTHRSFLDRFAGEDLPALLLQYKEKYHCYTELKKELAALSMDESEKLRRLDILNYEINELEQAGLVSGEEEELKQKCAVLSNAQKLLSSAGQALDLLYDNPDGACAYHHLARASELLFSVSEMDVSAAEMAESAEQALVLVEDTARKLKRYLDHFEMGEGQLEVMQERLDLIYRLKRKYGGEVSDLLSYLENSIRERDAISMSDKRKIEIEKELSLAYSECVHLAERLTEKRKKASEALSEAIGENLAFLNMEGARFYAEITPKEMDMSGADEVEFMLSANLGEPEKPLAKIISGGELSRIMLAIQSVLSEGDAAGTLIFDEIDTGVSGRAAQKLGEKLRELSEKKQVLCVTHLAQVAAKAKRHYLIDKKETDGSTKTTVTLLDYQGRVEELSRIIGGETISDTTKRQAEEMLDD